MVEPRSPERPTHILVVDDESRWLNMASGILAAAGLTHETADDTKSALEILATGKVSAVITDSMIDGWPTIAAGAKEVDTIVAVMSASSVVVRDAIKEGHAAFNKFDLDKPEELQRLLRAVAPEQFPELQETTPTASKAPSAASRIKTLLRKRREK